MTKKQLNEEKDRAITSCMETTMNEMQRLFELQRRNALTKLRSMEKNARR